MRLERPAFPGLVSHCLLRYQDLLPWRLQASNCKGLLRAVHYLWLSSLCLSMYLLYTHFTECQYPNINEFDNLDGGADSTTISDRLGVSTGNKSGIH